MAADYLTRLARALRREVDPRGDGDDGLEGLYRIYAVLAMAKGEAVTNADVHDAWAAYTLGRDPRHRSLKPYHELDPAVRRLDTPYRDAIRAVARRAAGRGRA